MRWFALLLLTGCLVVPKSRETTRVLGRYTAPVEAGPAGVVSLYVTESYATIHVTATRARRCYEETKQRYEHRVELDGDVVSGDFGGADPRALFLVGVVAAPLFLVSAAITEVAVATSTPEVDHYDRTVRVTATDCPLEAGNARVVLVMPSGAVVGAQTDEHGLASVKIPAGEPAQGMISVRVAGAEARVVYP